MNLKKMFLIGLVALPLSSTVIYGEDSLLPRVSGKLAARGLYKTESEKSFIEDHITIKVEKTFKNFKVVGIARSGSSYADNWDTVKESGKEFDVDPTISVRNLYIEVPFGENKVQFGSLPVYIGAKPTGISGTGWIDGGRLIIDTSFGIIKIVGGSVSDLKNTDLFSRDRELNYFEIQISKQVFKNLCVDAALEKYEEQESFKLGAAYDLELAGERVITFVSDILVDANTEYLVSGGIKTDLIELITGIDTGIIFDIRHQYMSEDMHRPQSSYFTSEEHSSLVRIKIPLSRYITSINEDLIPTFDITYKHDWQNSEKSYVIGAFSWSFDTGLRKNKSKRRKKEKSKVSYRVEGN